jgi:hypothetical protein
MTCLLLFILASFGQIFPLSVTVDDFRSPLGTSSDKLVAPVDWSSGNNKRGKIDYYLVKERGNTFLRGEYLPETSGKVIYTKKRVNLSDYSMLSWKWRAKKFPNLQAPDGVEESDNVATVYVLFKKGWSNYLIKYSWSQFNCKTKENNGPFYFKSRSSKAFWAIYIRPLRCTNKSIKGCADPANKWVSEKVNLIDDFKLFFKKDWLPEYVEGIGVLVDGDQTETTGVSADFDDFVLSSE